MKKISLNEMRSRNKKFKEKIYYLKKCNIRIYFKEEVINKVIFLDKDEFESLVKNLESFEINLVNDKRLEKFQQCLWQIAVGNNKMTIISRNRDIKQEVTLKINLKSNNKIIITRRILWDK